MKYLYIFLLILVLPGIEHDIANLSVEHAWVFVGDTPIYSTVGDNNSFWIPDINILDNATLLHNHPVNEGPSKKDMDLALRANVYQMIIVTHNGIWTTIRPFTNYTFQSWNSI
jgi:hypothetical protein